MSSDFSFAPERQRERSLSLPEDTPPSSTDRKVSDDFTGKYPYEPLQSKEHIRLLRLEPPVASSTQNIPVISATLREVNLSAVGESPCPPYKALSYEWGSPPSNPSDTPTMLLDNHLIRIRQNLYDALQSILHNHHRLYGESPLYLWVDALCINQLDDWEKGHQVQLMKTIYWDAETVIVWLGMGTACTGEAMELLKMEWKDLHEYMEEGNLSRKERQGITDLYCNATYWRRVWILQEFVLARDYVVLCNRAFVTKRCFERGPKIARWWSVKEARRKSRAHTNRPSPVLFWKAPVERMIALRNLFPRPSEVWEPSGPTLDKWLDTVYSYGFKATDPRDYVFALLGISHDRDDLEIVPNYELSTSEVYGMVISTYEARPRTVSLHHTTKNNLADLLGIARDRALELQQILKAEAEDMSSLED
ncbi:HET-domain-containing protein [Neurospora crassa]|uniref:Heterokaryon incompatibility domain-containing protein n=2 Tax=Neurospora crassa TaxID=5141 RepID=F5HF39_NEUCR|nr:hypothetical protein NCU01592 [Neurospora crassa OR74A]EAA27267.2 hypothetical protein NCU01592 [Neurospora crassa OR74A]KHE87139.1 HET-domain-containing protein [Neurospora crassa]CAB91377.2 related to heterokaryon incompatibility protein [Neurospora crassa]|eukprot:XP_956503.2 hypothetical protein NCU01592 [Neurospora crassa OR74A]